MSKLGKVGKFFGVLSHIATSKNYKEYLSFAQAGEDRVLRFLFTSMGRKRITYLEIGTNNPIEINNTYLFYVGGSKGVCIEPNPVLIPKIRKYRPDDICLNVGISGDDKNTELDFYIFDESDSEKGLSTFSKEQAEHVQSTTHIKIAEVKKIPVIPIKNVLDKYFPDKAPDLLSIDVEGLDFDILRSIDYNSCRPVAICVETVNFTMDHRKTKNTELIDFMDSKGYFVYGDTGLNTIFADRALFQES